MTLRTLLNQPVTVVHPVDQPTGYGWGAAADRTAILANLQQSSTFEDSTGFPAATPDTTLTTWVLFCAPDVVIGPADRVEVDVRVFEVDGDPNVVCRGNGVAHHLEVQLRSVTGDLAPEFSVAGSIVPPPLT